jgi:DNA-binding MarR family transcriptional regulator
VKRNDTRYELDTQVGFLLRLASQRHSILFQETLRDITPTQFSVLVRLFEVGQCSQNELGRQTAMDQATIKGVVGRLKAKGLVELVADPTDKRRFLVSIPKKHWKLKADLHAMGHAITRNTLEPLSRSERATFLKLLSKLT